MAYSFQNSTYKGTARRQRKSRWGSVAPFLATGCGFVAFALLVPSNPSQKSEARIFTQGLSIQIDRSSPAFAALEDSLAEDTHADLPDDSSRLVRPPAQVYAQLQSETLVSGMTSAVPLAARIEKETKREEALIAQERAAKEEAAQRLVTAFGRSLPSDEIAEAMSSGATVIANGEIQKMPQAIQAPINHPTVVLSLRQLGVGSRAELARSLMGPLAQAARSVDPVSNSRVARNDFDRPLRRDPFANPPAGRTVAGQTGDLLQKSFAPEAGVATDETADENQNENIRQLVINGTLEFTGGVAITSSNDRVTIFREDEGEKLEPGAVWLRDARYEIFIDRPVGRLVAELRTISGDILGRGYYELDTLPKLESNRYRANGISVKIGPVPHGIIGRIASGSVAGSKSYSLANASVQLEQLPYSTVSAKDGKFAEQNLLEGSSIVTRAERSGSWGTLAFAQAGKNLDVSLFSDQAMRALISAGAPTDSAADRNSGFIWGKVTRAGSTVAGARVDLMTSEKKIKPIYFNKLGMPDPSLTATTANGLYAFFPVAPGAHAVQAADAHGLTEPSLFPIDVRTVTQVDMELKISQKAKVRVFDAFRADWPLAAEVSSAGRLRGAQIPRTGEMKVTFAGGKNLLVLDADAGSTYTKTRLSLSRDQRVIDFPMIQSLWLERLRGNTRISAEPGAGTVVGFVRGMSVYKVALDENSLSATTRIFYFDEKGNLTRNTYGESGGGFVMFNVPEGFRTVLLQPSGTTKALATTVLVDSAVTNVLSKTIQ